MHAKLAFVLLCSCVIFLTACGGEGTTTLPSNNATPPVGGSGPTLAFVTTTLPAATESTQYTAIVKATGSSTGSYSWSVSSGTPQGSFSMGPGLPDELILGGIFTPAGSYTFDVTVGDFAGQSLTRSFTIVVNASTNISLVISSFNTCWEDQDYSATASVYGGTQPFTFSMTAGLLPSGISLSPQVNYADISGTATQSGQFNFTLRVDDAAGKHATASYQLYVFPARTWTALSGAPVDQQGSVCVDMFSRLWVWGGRSGTTPGQGQPINTGYEWDLQGTPTAITGFNAPSPRFGHSAICTSNEMIVWGGRDSATTLGDGKRLTTYPQAWTAMSSAGAPSARSGHSAVWNGNEMFVWGGCDSLGNTLNDGAAYNPVSDSWRPISSVNAPQARANHRAEIVGGSMVVYAGTWSSTTSIPADLLDGGIYDIASDTWTRFGSFGQGSGGTPTIVCSSVAQALLWGTPGSNQGVNLTLPSQSFGYMSTQGAPSARVGHSATWTGKYMIVFGGENGGLLNNGGVYNPATDSWSNLASGVPQARKNQRAFWSGHQLLIFGGEGTDISGQPVMLGAAALYTP